MATQLQIPNPCQEKWSEMTTIRPDCRHCGACDRNIVDFTMKTDHEILQYLHQNNWKICGKFRADQLGRPIFAPSPPHQGFRALATGLIALFSWSQGIAQQPTPAPPQELSPKPQQDSVKGPTHQNTGTQDTIRTISGRVLDAVSGEPLIGVTVRFANSGIGTSSDWDGYFNLKIPMQALESNPLKLRLYYTGYEAKLVELPSMVLQNNLALLPVHTQMQLSEHPIEFMGIVRRVKPTYEYRKTPVVRIKLFFRRLFR